MEEEVEVLDGGSSAVESPGTERKWRTESRASSMQAFGGASMGGFPLTRLNEGNYQTWSIKAETLLREGGSVADHCQSPGKAQ